MSNKNLIWNHILLCNQRLSSSDFYLHHMERRTLGIGTVMDPTGCGMTDCPTVTLLSSMQTDKPSDCCIHAHMIVESHTSVKKLNIHD